MKISVAGAGVGALVGCLGRGVVVLLNLDEAQSLLAIMALPSAGIGLLVGAIAGAFGKPILGAVVGAILSGVVFELFMFACASLIGSFRHEVGTEFFISTIKYGLEMAGAGAIAGAVGGWVGKMSLVSDKSKPVISASFGDGQEKPEEKMNS